MFSEVAECDVVLLAEGGSGVPAVVALQVVLPLEDASFKTVLLVLSLMVVSVRSVCAAVLHFVLLGFKALGQLGTELVLQQDLGGRPSERFETDLA